MTDSTQAIVWQADYDPFGKATLVASTVTNNIRFPGQYFDAESGLHYNYYRDYNPNDGRYMQSDPIGLDGGLNTYSYAGENSINNIDPLGLACSSANGMASCTTPSGLNIQFPVPSTWPAYIGPDALFYHDYSVPVEGIGDANLILNGIINSPTPGNNDRCASASGALNDAGDGFGLVRSYLVNDINTGAEVVVNVTEPSHSRFPGYVARTAFPKGSGRAGAITDGEGQEFWQSFDLLTDQIATDLWGGHTQGIFNSGGDAQRCGCQ